MDKALERFLDMKPSEIDYEFGVRMKETTMKLDNKGDLERREYIAGKALILRPAEVNRRGLI